MPQPNAGKAIDFIFRTGPKAAEVLNTLKSVQSAAGEQMPEKEREELAKLIEVLEAEEERKKES